MRVYYDTDPDHQNPIPVLLMRGRKVQLPPELMVYFSTLSSSNQVRAERAEVEEHGCPSETSEVVAFIYCRECGKSVSSGFWPVPTDTPDRGIIIRALVICPECLEKFIHEVKHE